jgi:hypothetical protein
VDSLIIIKVLLVNELLNTSKVAHGNSSGVGLNVDTPTKTQSGFQSVTSKPSMVVNGRSLHQLATAGEKLRIFFFTQ